MNVHLKPLLCIDSMQQTKLHSLFCQFYKFTFLNCICYHEMNITCIFVIYSFVSIIFLEIFPLIIGKSCLLFIPIFMISILLCTSIFYVV